MTYLRSLAALLSRSSARDAETFQALVAQAYDLTGRTGGLHLFGGLASRTARVR